MELFSSAQYSSQKVNLANNSKKYPEKLNLHYSRSMVFHIKTRVCLKCFENDCRDYFRKTYQGLDGKTWAAFYKFLPCQLFYFTFFQRSFNIVILM